MFIATQIHKVSGSYQDMGFVVCQVTGRSFFFLDGPQGGLLGFDWGGLVALIDFHKRCCIYFPYCMSEVWVTRHVQLFSLTQGISPMCQVLDIEVGPFCA
jgi:hypothetical protein